MRVFKSAPLFASVLALVAGCGLDMGGLSADVPVDDAGGLATTSDGAAASPEAAPPTGQSDGGDEGGDAIATTLDASSAPEAKAPAEAGPTGPPPPPKGPGPGEGDDASDQGPGKGH